MLEKRCRRNKWSTVHVELRDGMLAYSRTVGPDGVLKLCGTISLEGARVSLDRCPDRIDVAGAIKLQTKRSSNARKACYFLHRVYWFRSADLEDMTAFQIQIDKQIVTPVESTFVHISKDDVRMAPASHSPHAARRR
jgi:hypothetical protein